MTPITKANISARASSAKKYKELFSSALRDGDKKRFAALFAQIARKTRNANGVPNYAPLYVHSFRLIAPRKSAEAQTLYRHYQTLADIDNTPERLHWCRHNVGLMQKAVAARIGVSRAVYVDMETGAVDYCPAAVAERLSELYGVPLESLLDGYFKGKL